MLGEGGLHRVVWCIRERELVTASARFAGGEPRRAFQRVGGGASVVRGGSGEHDGSSRGMAAHTSDPELGEGSRVAAPAGVVLGGMTGATKRVGLTGEGHAEVGIGERPMVHRSTP